MWNESLRDIYWKAHGSYAWDSTYRYRILGPKAIRPPGRNDFHIKGEIMQAEPRIDLLDLIG